MKTLTSQEEASYLAELTGQDHVQQLQLLKDSFNVLYTRAQMLLSLVALCLTITGFSGPRIAESGLGAKVCLITGIVLVVICAFILFWGPLQIRWITSEKGETFQETVVALIERRNYRTRLFVIATQFLITGLSFYVGALLFYFLR